VKRKFYLASYFIFFIIVFSTNSMVMASAQKFSLNINGVEVENQEPKIINQTVFIPIRSVSLLPNLNVDWDNETKTVFVIDTITKETLKLIIGKDIAYKGDSKLILTTPARIINGSTYIPLRFVDETLNASVEWDTATKTAVVYNTDKKLAETIKGEENKMELSKIDDVVMLANKQADGGMFKEITVRTKDKSKTFPWVNVTNPTYYPTVSIADVNADGKEEVVVFLTTGYGTGVHVQKIHILDKDNLTEILPGIGNPLDTIKKKVNSKITKDNGKVQVDVKWNSKKIEKTYNELDAGVWNDYVAFGGVVEYQLHNNKIYAIVPGNVATTWYVVVAIVEYGPDFKAKNITVKDMDKTNYPDVIED